MNTNDKGKIVRLSQPKLSLPAGAKKLQPPEDPMLGLLLLSDDLTRGLSSLINARGKPTRSLVNALDRVEETIFWLHKQAYAEHRVAFNKFAAMKEAESQV